MRAILSGNKKNKGISIIEILLVVSIIGIIVSSLLGLAVSSLKNSTTMAETTRANALAQETIEAVRNFRDAITWNNNDPSNQYDGLGVAATGTAYYPAKFDDNLLDDKPPKWQLLQGQETLNGFTRQVVFDNVLRDAINGNISSSGTVPDSNTKKITVTVSWKNQQVQIITYLTNWRQ